MEEAGKGREIQNGEMQCQSVSIIITIMANKIQWKDECKANVHVAVWQKFFTSNTVISSEYLEKVSRKDDEPVYIEL